MNLPQAGLARIPNDDTNANEAQFYLGLATFYGGHMEKADSAFHALAARLPLTEVLNNLGVIAARRGQKTPATTSKKLYRPILTNLTIVSIWRLSYIAKAIVPELRASCASCLRFTRTPKLRAFLRPSPPVAQPAHLPLQRIKRNYDESTFRQLALEIDNSNEERLAKSDPSSHAAFHLHHGQELLQTRSGWRGRKTIS